MANEKRGYIKLFRTITENELWISSDKFDVRSAWIDLLLMANHKDVSTVKGTTRITYLRGRVYTSTRILAEKWHWNRDKVLNYLNMLESMGMIRRDATAKGTCLTIIKWDFFQLDEMENPDTHPDTHPDTDPDTHPPLTRMNKNEHKNEKEKRLGTGGRKYEK